MANENILLIFFFGNKTTILNYKYSLHKLSTYNLFWGWFELLVFYKLTTRLIKLQRFRIWENENKGKTSVFFRLYAKSIHLSNTHVRKKWTLKNDYCIAEIQVETKRQDYICKQYTSKCIKMQIPTKWTPIKLKCDLSFVLPKNMQFREKYVMFFLFHTRNYINWAGKLS